MRRSLYFDLAQHPGGGNRSYWHRLPTATKNIKNQAYLCIYLIIYLLSNRLCGGLVYKLFYYLVLHSRPILLDMHT